MPLMMDPPAAAAQSLPTSYSASPTLHPTDIAVPLPYSPHTTLHMQVTRLETSNLIFLTSSDPSSGSSQSALGSFVYALPNRYQPSDPFCTALYSLSGTIDFATRVAKILARKTEKPVYVGCSVVLGNPTVEEEVAGVRTAVEEAMKVMGADQKG